MKTKKVAAIVIIGLVILMFIAPLFFGYGF